MELPTPDVLKTGLTFSADGRSLYFLGGKKGEPERTDLYVISESAPRPALAAEAAGLKSVPMVDPSGAVLLHTVPSPNQNPLRRPVSVGEAGGAGQPGEAGRGGGPGGVGVQETRFAIVDLRTRKVSVVAGSVRRCPATVAISRIR